MPSGPVRVSHVAAFRRWKDDDDLHLGWLIDYFRKNEETEAMRKGTAFHKALELACESESYFIEAEGYTFHFTGEMSIELPVLKEIRRGKDYGGIIVSGQADGLIGNLCIDYKSTETFSAEKYLSGVQHKFYMDIFGLDRFRWYVFEMKEMDSSKPAAYWDKDALQIADPEHEKHYCVHTMHTLEQYRYPGMEQECKELALEFKALCDRWLPGFPYEPIPPPKPTVKEQLRESVASLEPIWEMKPTKGRNLIAVGWMEGILRCAFAAKEGRRFYSYRGVPESEFVKLLRSPFPDRLFSSNIKAKYEAA